MRYRLALDLGPTSLGWALLRLNEEANPVAVVRAGVRIFSDGRNPKDGSSLAVARREARAMRRRRDRLLKRKTRLMRLLTEHGFFPTEPAQRKALEPLNPYALRAKGLDQPLRGPEFARALFHLNQRRGFKSNRKADNQDSDSGALKTAIAKLRNDLVTQGYRTVGQWLHQRQLAGGLVRARYRQQRVAKDDGKTRLEKSYDLYIDRAMVEQEFDLLWQVQAQHKPALFTEAARVALKDCLLHQRELRPVVPGRCTLMPELERAPRALPSAQRCRIYQELNHLYLLQGDLSEQALTLAQRDTLAQALERHSKCSFSKIRTLLKLDKNLRFNLEDGKREDLKGNATSVILAKPEHFGPAWYDWDEQRQDQIVQKLVGEQSEALLVTWLAEHTGVDEARAQKLASVGLPEGYGALSAPALARLLPALRADVISYDKAVLAAGFEHHSNISHAASGEILPALPYYGCYLQRHVGFGSNNSADPDEKRYGRIANPTVHIGLNQVRVVVNTLICRYGHPSEVVVELARDLKQSRDERKQDTEQQTRNQRRNLRLRADAAAVLGIAPETVKTADLQKLILWEELSPDIAERCCPYSGVPLSACMVLSGEVEIEHILPFSQTLDDSLNNKTVATRLANRIKGNRTPWQARHDFAAQGWDYDGISARAGRMPGKKSARFTAEGYEKWLRDDKDFLARALNDTRHLSRVAREYLSLICPGGTRVIPGRMTALLRGKFGLNRILGEGGEKNRNDHRHHAVDACVIGVTDQRMLQRFAQASASARERQLERLVEAMPLPWPSYPAQVARAVQHLWVSHKPDHGYQGAMHNDTAYSLHGDGHVSVHKTIDGQRQRQTLALKVIEFTAAKANARHGLLPNGKPRPYKGYKGDSNYCLEIVRTPKGEWQGEIISTYRAYQIVRQHGEAALRQPHTSASGKALVMRLMIGDCVRLEIEGRLRTMRVASLNTNGGIVLADHFEANVDARNRDPNSGWRYSYKTAGSLQKARGRPVGVSPIGDLRDPGFRA